MQLSGTDGKIPPPQEGPAECERTTPKTQEFPEMVREKRHCPLPGSSFRTPSPCLRRFCSTGRHPVAPLPAAPGTTAAHLLSCPRPALAAGSWPRTCRAGRAPPSTPRPVPRARMTQFLFICRRSGERSGRQASQATPKIPYPQSFPCQSRPALQRQLLFLPVTKSGGAALPWWGGEGKGGVVHTQGTCDLGGSEGWLLTERPPSSSGTLRRKRGKSSGVPLLGQRPGLGSPLAEGRV